MSTLKIGIVEDELLVGKTIFVMLQQIGYSPIKAVRNYDDAVKMIRSESPDLLLIDIILDGEKDGIMVAETVNKEFSIPFIFLTANSDTATVNRAKEVKPSAYLVKPFYENDLYTSIEIAFDNYNLHKLPSAANNNTPSKYSSSIFIKEGTVFHKVELSDILYIETNHVYLNIYTLKKTYLVRSKLEDFINAYLTEKFIRIHRSFVINIKHLESINSLSVQIAGKDVPLHKNYKEQLLTIITAVK